MEAINSTGTVERQEQPRTSSVRVKGKGRKRGPRRKGVQEPPSSLEGASTVSNESLRKLPETSVDETKEERRVHDFCAATGMILTKKSKLVLETPKDRGYIATLRISLGGKRRREAPEDGSPLRGGRHREGKLLVSKSSFVLIGREKDREEGEEFRDLWPRILKSLRIEPRDFSSPLVTAPSIPQKETSTSLPPKGAFPKESSFPTPKEGSMGFPFPFFRTEGGPTPAVDFAQMGRILSGQTEAERLKQTQNMLRPFAEVLNRGEGIRTSPELLDLLGEFMNARPEDAEKEEFREKIREKSQNMMGELMGRGGLNSMGGLDTIKMIFGETGGEKRLSSERLRFLSAEESPDEDEDPTIDPELDDELRDILGS